MVLGWKRPGRVWICQANIKREANVSLSFLFLSKNIYVISLLCDIIKRMNKKEVNNGTIRKIKRI